MSKSIEGYQPLLSQRGSGSLWLAEDHLLMIETSCLLLCTKETYRRLDYGNIQAILQTPSSRGAWMTALLALLTLALGIPGLTVSGNQDTDTFIRILLFAGALLFLLILIVHLSKGPTTTLVIQTAVRPWRLSPAIRDSHARKVIEAILPRIQQAQQHLTVVSDTTLIQAPPKPEAPPVILEPAGAASPHRLSMPAWICLLAYSLMMVGELFWSNQAASLAMILLGCLFFVLVIISYSRGGGFAACGGKTWFFSGIGTVAISVAYGYGVVMIGTINTAMQSRPDRHAFESPSLLKELARFPDNAHMALTVITYSLAAICMVIAIGAMLTISRQHSRARRLRDSTDGTSS